MQPSECTRSMNDFPIYLESTLFPEVFIVANKHFSPPADGAPLDVKVDSRIAIQPVPKSNSRFVVELRIKLDADMTTDTPYFFNIVCMVLLSVDETVPAVQRRALAMQAGHTIAYPAIREMVANVTARQPWGQFSIGFGFLSPDALERPPEDAPWPEAPKPARKRRKKAE